MSTDSSWQERFIERLRGLNPPDNPRLADRQTLAHLRQCIGKPDYVTLAKLGHLFFGVPEYRLEDAILVAQLFGVHSDAGGRGTIGRALHHANKDTESDSNDKRFIVLVETSKEDLPDRLRHIVRLLKSKGIPIDFEQLLRDLNNWDHQDRFVQWNWSRDYWNLRDDSDDENPETETEEQQANESLTQD